jgi:hypothetical protein
MASRHFFSIAVYLKSSHAEEFIIFRSFAAVASAAGSAREGRPHSRGPILVIRRIARSCRLFTRNRMPQPKQIGRFPAVSGALRTDRAYRHIQSQVITQCFHWQLAHRPCPAPHRRFSLTILTLEPTLSISTQNIMHIVSDPLAHPCARPCASSAT